MTDDRDNRRNRDPLHARAGEIDSGDFSDRDRKTPVETLGRVIAAELDASIGHAIDAAVVAGLVDEVKAMGPDLRICREAHERQRKRNRWWVPIKGVSLTALVAFLGWVASLLLSMGASNERGRVQSETVKANAEAIRNMQQTMAAQAAVLAILQARLTGRQQE